MTWYCKILFPIDLILMNIKTCGEKHGIMTTVICCAGCCGIFQPELASSSHSNKTPREVKWRSAILNCLKTVLHLGASSWNRAGRCDGVIQTLILLGSTAVDGAAVVTEWSQPHCRLPLQVIWASIGSLVHTLKRMDTDSVLHLCSVDIHFTV